jgi:S-adenosylmethionine decarboxylase
VEGKQLKALGIQLAVELFDCDENLLNNDRLLEQSLLKAAQDAGATVVGSVFHQFNPHGISGAIIIAESHIAVHTWPEYAYAALDIFTCGSTIDPRNIADAVKDALHAGSMHITRLQRGVTVGEQERSYAQTPT